MYRLSFKLEFVLMSVFLLVASRAAGQGLGTCDGSKEVACVIPNVFGDGITLSTPPGTTGAANHVAHFHETSEFFSNFLPLNTSLATQMALLPIASPASGFTYSLEQLTGATIRTPQTFGPILTERGETIGRGRISASVNYQRFRFDQIDGNDMGRLPGVMRHVPEGRATSDVIATTSDFNLKLDQFTFAGIVGVTPHLDVSVAVPLNDVRLGVTSDATLYRIDRTNNDCTAGTTVPCHFFDVNNRNGSTSGRFVGTGSATGFGDITLRAKYGIANTEGFAAAVLTDVRFPTGDERNFLGSGSWGVKPFIALTYKKNNLAPHINLGFQWNGDSILAGNVLDNTKGKLPNTFYYSAGTDLGLLDDKLTLIFDMVGQRLFDAPRVVISQFTATDPDAGTSPVDSNGAPLVGNPQTPISAVFPQVSQQTASFSINNAGVGAKVKLVRRLLLQGNVLFSFDRTGLRSRTVPMIGLSYVF